MLVYRRLGVDISLEAIAAALGVEGAMVISASTRPNVVTLVFSVDEGAEVKVLGEPVLNGLLCGEGERPFVAKLVTKDDLEKYQSRKA